MRKQVIEDTLKRLAREFTAKDIMVPTNELVCGDDTNEALQLLKKYRDYETIPIRSKNAITHYVVRGGTDDAIPLDIHRDIIGDGTSILDLVQILVKRRF